MGPLSLGDLTLIVVLFVTVIAGFFLIRALSHFGGILAIMKKTLDNNSESIDKMLNDIPKITEKAAEISSDAQVIVSALKEEQKVLDGTLKDISETIGAVSTTAKTINDDLFSKIKALFNALALLVNIILKKAGAKENGSDDDDGTDGTDGGTSKRGAKAKKRKRKRLYPNATQ